MSSGMARRRSPQLPLHEASDPRYAELTHAEPTHAELTHAELTHGEPTPAEPTPAEPHAGPAAETSKGARTRARLVDEGIMQFGANGYRHTSLAAVARNVGLTPAAAYPYFPAKHDLFLASADAAIGRLLADARKTSGTSSTPWLTLFTEIVHAIPTHALVQRILSDEEPDLVRECLELPSMKALFEQVTQTVHAAQANGIIRTDLDPGVLALGLETVFLGQLLFRVRSGTPEADQRAAAVGSLLMALLLPSS
jgi:AcrR family transcriptional regulator